MDQEQGMAIPGDAELPGAEAAHGTDGKALRDRCGPTWRGFALSILVAVVLSVMATLLLGGSWSSYTLRPAAAGASSGCGEGKSCCPPPQEDGG
ncbi:MAG: hypothetical protein FIA93_11970 [Deltaproteobacteria bacterium]|nr:hypothetical protein [Deltaproteobacteria bacterium]